MIPIHNVDPNLKQLIRLMTKKILIDPKINIKGLSFIKIFQMIRNIEHIGRWKKIKETFTKKNKINSKVNEQFHQKKRKAQKKKKLNYKKIWQKNYLIIEMSFGNRCHVS